MKKAWAGLVLCGVAVAATIVGCEELPGDRLAFPLTGGAGNVPGGGLDGLVTGVGVGSDCSELDCRVGLACNEDQVCEPAGTQGPGELCVIGPECADGLQCFFGPCPIPGVDQCPVCAPAGDSEAGEACQTDLDCNSGLKCALNGLSAECAPAGSVDLGGACVQQTDCYQGLFCNAGSCSLEPPLFEGVECEEPDDENVAALFEVPGAPQTAGDADYFSFPYPNDFRLGEDGRPDLGDFPTPGAGLIGFDIVQRYVDAIEAQADGWSANPTIIFRFTGEIDFESLADGGEEDRRVFVVDADDPLTGGGSPRLAREAFRYSWGSRTNYVCDDWVAIRLPGTALVPGHRYAAFITRDVRAASGDAIVPSPQFEAMLEAEAPSNDALAKAWTAHAPLRDVLAASVGTTDEFSADDILTGTVFTVGDIIDPMRQLAAAVDGADAPTASSWVKCGEGVSSPCPQAEGGRACGTGVEGEYDEYQALIGLPIFQEGTAPYAQTGGAIAEDVQRTEQVCVSLSLPTQAAPADGYPLVIFGHGTGGSSRSPLRPEVAGRLATETTPVVTLGFDQVQHGPRRGSGEGSDQEPDNLFFNFLNPDAARGNPLQGAADVLSIVRWASTGTLASAEETGASAITIDPTKIVVFGHSQGSTHASMAVPFSTLPGGVFSGNGGGLIEALLNKTNPVNIAGAIPFVVQDVDGEGNLRMGDKHPVLSLLQHFIDPADPVNFAPLLAARVEPTSSTKFVFQTFGLDDTYSPPATLARYFYAAEQMALASPPDGVNPMGDNDLGVTSVATVTVGTGSGESPSVCRQYDASSDGHFVVFDDEDANDDAIAFLSSLLAGTSPVVPAP